MLCPGCGGVLEAGTTLKTLNHDEYDCALCAAGYEPTLDEMVEVTFTVSPRVRKIAGHDPDSLPYIEYARQHFWGSGIDLPDDLEAAFRRLRHRGDRAAAGRKGAAVAAAAGRVLHRLRPGDARDPVHRREGRADQGAAVADVVFNKVQAQTETVEMRPGPLRLTLENNTDRRVLPGVWIANHALHDMMGKRKPFLTAKRLLTNQTFRDIYRTDTHGRRPAAEDHQPDVPVHRPEGLDRALRARRRSRRLRPGAPAFPRAARDRRVGGGRRGQDHRRRGDGDVPDAGPRAGGGAAHARGDAEDQCRARQRGSAC